MLQLVPASLPVLAGWAAETVCQLEVHQRKQWPENGLRFAEAILATLQFGKGGGGGGEEDLNQFMMILTLNQQRTEKESALSKLIHLINLLKDLQRLKQQFRIKLKLAEIQDEDKFNVVSLILDWIMDPEEIPGLMDGFLVKYMQQWGLSLEQTLMDYTLNLLHNTHYTWHWHVGAAPWEGKVLLLLPYIASVDEKSQVWNISIVN